MPTLSDKPSRDGKPIIGMAMDGEAIGSRWWSVGTLAGNVVLLEWRKMFVGDGATLSFTGSIGCYKAHRQFSARTPLE